VYPSTVLPFIYPNFCEVQVAGRWWQTPTNLHKEYLTMTRGSKLVKQHTWPSFEICFLAYQSHFVVSIESIKFNCYFSQIEVFIILASRFYHVIAVSVETTTNADFNTTVKELACAYVFISWFCFVLIRPSSGWNLLTVLGCKLLP